MEKMYVIPTLDNSFVYVCVCVASFMKQALCILAANLSLGLGILLQLNPLSQVVGASSLMLVAAYPLMKRVTDWPQLWLGMTFNWGAILVRLPVVFL